MIQFNAFKKRLLRKNLLNEFLFDLIFFMFNLNIHEDQRFWVVLNFESHDDTGVTVKGNN
jgi:hypothetical protein